MDPKITLHIMELPDDDQETIDGVFNARYIQAMTENGVWRLISSPHEIDWLGDDKPQYTTLATFTGPGAQGKALAAAETARATRDSVL